MISSKPRRLIAFVTPAILGILLASSAALGVGTAKFDLQQHDLWRVIHFICVPASQLGIPFPCSTVQAPTQTSPGYAILPVATGHVLTVPTTPIAGIESPEALDPASALYWEAAWSARGFLDRDFGRTIDRTDIAMAINSKFGRSQDQLHIHTACVAPAVKKAIETDRTHIGSSWIKMSVAIDGKHYTIRGLESEALAGTNVFDLLPLSVKKVPAMMARQTLVVVGATFDDRPGFYILSDQARDHGLGHGEALLDFTCGTSRFR